MARRLFPRFLGVSSLFPAWIGLGLLWVLSLPAHADVWAYIDEKGTAHFAAEPIDARYQLFFRGKPPSGDNGATGTPRAVTVPTAQPKLIAWFEVAPGFRSVKHLLREAASTHGVDYELLKALIATESGFDAAAVSPRGAVGLMQVMPATAGRFGVSADRRTSIEQKLADPATNIHAGASYLGYLLRLFPGQLELALAAYNAGEGAVERHGRKVPPFAETRLYVPRVLGIYRALLGGRRDPAHGVTAIHHRGSGDFPPPPTGCCLPPLPAAVAYLAITSRPPSPVA